MPDSETIEQVEQVEDAVLVDEAGNEIVARETGAALNLFGTDDPAAVIEKASRAATALAEVIEKRRLYKQIGGKKYVFVEGWQLLGSILGVFPVMESCEPVEINGIKGYRAIVAAQTRDGAVIGRASALCMRNESKWANADEYAVSSMAQTRAVSKCLRSPLGFIMQLAGFQATPEAEVPDGGFSEDKPAAPTPPDRGATPAERVLSPTLARIEQGMLKLRGKSGWSRDEVLKTAAQTFRRPIETLGELSEVEAKQIISAMEEYGGVKV